MNTFSASQSTLSPTARHLIRQAWKTVANAKKATASQHAAYCLLLGKDLDKAFTPLKRESKIQGYASGNPNLRRDEARRLVEEGRVGAFTPWAELLQAHPRSTSWGAPYEGGLEAIRANIEKQAQELNSPLPQPVLA